MMAGKSRGLQFSWLDTLEAVGKIVKKLESAQVPSCIHQLSSTNHSLSYVLAVRDWIQKIEKKEEGLWDQPKTAS